MEFIPILDKIKEVMGSPLDLVTDPVSAYEGMASGFNQGMAAFSGQLQRAGDWVQAKTGIPKGDLFHRAEIEYQKNAKFWDDQLKKRGSKAIPEFLTKSVGQAIPGMTQFMVDPVLAGPAAASKAKEEGKSETDAFIQGVAKRLMMGGVLKMTGELERVPRMAATGGAFATQTGTEGGSFTDIVNSFTTGVGFGAMGGEGKISAKDVMGEAKRLNTKLGERGSTSGEKSSLVPAIQYKGKTIKGEVGDNHDTIMKREGIEPDAEHERGFIPSSGGRFMGRPTAKQWLKKNDPETYQKWNEEVKGEGETAQKPLHSEERRF